MLIAIKFYILYSKFPITGWGARLGRQGRLSLVAQVASFISLPITIICGLLADVMASRVPIIILLRMMQIEIFFVAAPLAKCMESEQSLPEDGQFQDAPVKPLPRVRCERRLTWKPSLADES